MSAAPSPFRPDFRSDELDASLERMSSAQTLHEIYETIRTSVRRHTGSDGIALILREGDLCYYVEEDAIGPLWKGRKFSMAACISGWCMLHRQIVSIADITVDPRIPQDLYTETFVRSLVMVPIGTEQSIAALGSYWRTHYLASPEQIAMLSLFGQATGAALECLPR